jgi:hypothetical protein
VKPMDFGELERTLAQGRSRYPGDAGFTR